MSTVAVIACNAQRKADKSQIKYYNITQIKAQVDCKNFTLRESEGYKLRWYVSQFLCSSCDLLHEFGDAYLAV